MSLFLSSSNATAESAQPVKFYSTTVNTPMEGWRLKLGVGALSRRDTSETPVRAAGPPDPPVDKLLEHRTRTRVRFLRTNQFS